MQYMLLIYTAENAGPQPGDSDFGDYMQAYMDFTDRVKADGAHISANALQPTSTSTTLTKENGKVETMDGPFAETKEHLGGYYLLECKDIDKALEYAEMIPSVDHGRVEVRPIMVIE